MITLDCRLISTKGNQTAVQQGKPYIICHEPEVVISKDSGELEHCVYR